MAHQLDCSPIPRPFAVIGRSSDADTLTGLALPVVGRRLVTASPEVRAPGAHSGPVGAR